MNKEELYDKGYDEWKENHFQKKSKDENGIQYFLNIRYFNELLSNKNKLEGFECKVQFQNAELNDKDLCFNISFNCSAFNVDEVELFVWSNWVSLDNPYYEKFNKRK